MSQRFLPIKDLTTWTTTFCIEGRILEKGPLSGFKRTDGNGGRVGNVTIMDKDGSVIRATFWGEAADKWMAILEQGKVYTFSGGRVSLANRKFDNSTHMYQLTFDTDAKINEVSSETSGQQIPTYRKSNFTTLRDVKNSSRELPFLVDLSVVLKWVAPTVENFINKATSDAGVRRSTVVADDTGHEMSLTLFGVLAEDEELLSAYGDGSSPVVLALQNVQIRDYRGRVGSSIRTTHLLVNPPGTEFKNLAAWYTSEGKPMTFKSLSEGPTQLSSPDSSQQLSTLQDVVQHLQQAPVSSASDPNDRFSVIAEVSSVSLVNRQGELNFYFSACNRCGKKINAAEGEGFRCEVCAVSVEKPSLKYLFPVTLIDQSGSGFRCRAFDGPGKSLLGRTADDLVKNVGIDRMECRLVVEDEPLWKRYRFRVRAKRELYAGEERTNITIIAAEPLDYTADGHRLMKDIVALLPGASEFQPCKKRTAPSSQESEPSTYEFEEREGKKMKTRL